MRVVNGAIIQSYTAELKKRLDESAEELLSLAVFEIRQRFQSEAKEVLLPFEIDLEFEDIQFRVPQRGDKRKLLELSERNAKYYMIDKHKQEKLVESRATYQTHPGANESWSSP